MILVPEEKNKTENFAKKQQEKAESFLTRSLALQSEAEQGIPEAPQVSAMQNRPVMNFNPTMPFTSSMPQGGLETPPSFNINEMFQERIEPTEEPVRDAAAYERVKRQQKFNAIAKGLQLIFNTSIAGPGEVVPGPYEGGMTQALMNQVQGLDDRYFKELADYRDRELRAQLFNIQQQNQADQLRLQEMRRAADLAREEKRYEEAKEMQAEADQYKRDITEREMALKEKGLASQESWREKQSQDANRAGKLQTLSAYESQYDDLYNQWKQASDNFEEERAEELKAQMDENMEVRKNLMKQLSGREGFESEEGNPDPAKGGQVSFDDFVSDIKLQTRRGRISPEEAVEQIVAALPEGYNRDKAREKAMAEFGITNPEQSGSPDSTGKAKERVLATKQQNLDKTINEISEGFNIPKSEIAKLNPESPDFTAKVKSILEKHIPEDQKGWVDWYTKVIKLHHEQLLKAKQ